jgi:hypothetical protein
VVEGRDRGRANRQAEQLRRGRGVNSAGDGDAHTSDHD